MDPLFAKRTLFVSGGASWAGELLAPMGPAAPADDSAARKLRRFCFMAIHFSLWIGFSGAMTCHPAQLFSSRLSSLKKRQSVPSAMILLGLDLIIPASRSRSA